MKTYEVVVRDPVNKNVVLLRMTQPAQTAKQASSIVKAFHWKKEGIVRARELKTAA